MNSTPVWFFHPLPLGPFPWTAHSRLFFFFSFFEVRNTPVFAESSAGLPQALARWQEEDAGRQELDSTTPPLQRLFSPPGLRPSRKKTACDRIGFSATVPNPTTMPALPCLLPNFTLSARLAHAPEAGQVLASGAGSAPQGFSANHVVPGISCSSGSCVTLCPGLTQYFFFFLIPRLIL